MSPRVEKKVTTCHFPLIWKRLYQRTERCTLQREFSVHVKLMWYLLILYTHEKQVHFHLENLYVSLENVIQKNFLVLANNHNFPIEWLCTALNKHKDYQKFNCRKYRYITEYTQWNRIKFQTKIKLQIIDIECQTDSIFNRMKILIKNFHNYYVY